MSETKYENRTFERLNFDDFPTLRETFSFKNEPIFQNFWPEFHTFVPLSETQFLFREFCTPLRDFQVVKKVPLSLAHTRDLFLPKWTPRDMQPVGRSRQAERPISINQVPYY